MSFVKQINRTKNAMVFFRFWAATVFICGCIGRPLLYKLVVHRRCSTSKYYSSSFNRTKTHAPTDKFGRAICCAIYNWKYLSGTRNITPYCWVSSFCLGINHSFALQKTPNFNKPVWNNRKSDREREFMSFLIWMKVRYTVNKPDNRFGIQKIQCNWESLRRMQQNGKKIKIKHTQS